MEKISSIIKEVNEKKGREWLSLLPKTEQQLMSLAWYLTHPKLQEDPVKIEEIVELYYNAKDNDFLHMEKITRKLDELSVKIGKVGSIEKITLPIQSEIKPVEPVPTKPKQTTNEDYGKTIEASVELKTWKIIDDREKALTIEMEKIEDEKKNLRESWEQLEIGRKKLKLEKEQFEVEKGNLMKQLERFNEERQQFDEERAKLTFERAEISLEQSKLESEKEKLETVRKGLEEMEKKLENKLSKIP